MDYYTATSYFMLGNTFIGIGEPFCLFIIRGKPIDAIMLYLQQIAPAKRFDRGYYIYINV